MSIGQPSKEQRAFFSGRFVLELGDGGKSGAVDLVYSVDGGHFKAEAIGEKVGAEGLETRQPGRQKFDDITVQIGTAMSPKFWEWIKASIDNKYKRQNGAVVAYDFDGKERSRRSFYDALIAEVQFPTLDAKAKQPAFITVKIAPERMEWKKGSGSPAPTSNPVKQKLWIPANFRFRIDGLGDGMRWVQKVDALTIKQNIIMNPIGKEKYVRKEVGRIEYPNLSFYIPETYGEPFLTYWKDFVGEMNHSGDREKTGTIEYLSSDLSKTLMTLSFEGVGITGVTYDKHEAGTDNIRMYKVDCYMEKMKLTPGAGT
jgi:phage tail-like protein